MMAGLSRGLSLSATVSQEIWENAVDLLQSPKSQLRVISLEVGTTNPFGAGAIEVNPWLDIVDLRRADLCEIDVDNLSSYGLPLSVAEALERPAGQVKTAVQSALVFLLHDLARESRSARDQLNEHQKIPLKFGAHLSKSDLRHVADIERLCKEQRTDTGYLQAVQDWTAFGSTCEVWLACIGGQRTKVRLQSEPNKDAAVFDIDGCRLTGGRVWASSLLLARWLTSLHLGNASPFEEQKLCLGKGAMLEVGAGLGLAGMSLAKLGHKVVLSDREPLLLDRLQDSINHNQVQEFCRVINLDWKDVGVSKMRRLLRTQKFSTVIGADVVYSEDQADMLVNVLRHALPDGGLALFVNPMHHRKGVLQFADKLRKDGHRVHEANLSAGSHLQNLLCGSFEPGQEFGFVVVHVADKGSC